MLNLEVTGFESLVNLDPNELTVRITRKLVPLWRACIREFVNAAASEVANSLASSKYSTGMTLATFRPLAADVRMKGQLEGIIQGTIRKTKGDIYTSFAFPGPKRHKSAALGEQMGRKAYSYNFVDNPKRPQFQFTFSIPVLQFYLHENGLGKHNSHFYQAMDLGRTAFIEHWLSRAPDLITSEVEGYLL